MLPGLSYIRINLIFLKEGTKRMRKEMKIKENKRNNVDVDVDKIWEYFVVEESKLITEETKIFDAIMDARAAAKLTRR